MQGVFAQHAGTANWADVLDPGFDDETQRGIRDNEAAQRVMQRAQAARGAAAVGPAPPPVKYPTPPSQRFTVGNTVFFILKGGASDAAPPRAGKWGHYLVPYVTEDDGTGRPFTATPENNPEQHPHEGAPGDPDTDDTSKPIPSGKWCVEGRDFVRAVNPATYWEVGLDHVRRVLEEAETMDLAFARRMEGFGTAPRSAVWDCLDPDYDPSDREAVLNQFMSKYLERFYTRLDPGNTPGASKVAEEALHKHKAFCKAWTQKHYKTLTPAITSPAEALATDFLQNISASLIPAPVPPLSSLLLARVFMRHETFAAEFAQALHFYSGSLEQGRGGRNASYKQMRQTESARITSYKRFGGFLETHWRTLTQAIREITSDADHCLKPLGVDWYDILGQMPPIHRYFDEPHSFQGVADRQNSMDGGVLPPWLFSRDR